MDRRKFLKNSLLAAGVLAGSAIFKQSVFSNTSDTENKKMKILNAFSYIFYALFFIMLTIFSVGVTLNNINKTNFMFAGISSYTISSPSMTNSGFFVGDKILIKSVDSKTIKPGDMIAFYAYSGDYSQFDINTCTKVEEFSETKYSVSISSFFGYYNSKIYETSKTGAKPIFHIVKEVYEDESGIRWFKTYGSSNSNDDPWCISENVVIGMYDENFNQTFAGLIQSNALKIVILLFIILLFIWVQIDIFVEIKKSFLIDKCLQGRIKVYDKKCKKYNIANYLNEKQKMKVLSFANSNDYNLMIFTMWQYSTCPAEIRKEYIKKNLKTLR